MRSSLAIALLASALAGCGGGSDNSPPSLQDDQARTDEDESVVIDVLANDSDADGDALEILAANTDGGAVEIVDGGIRVTPDADFFGAIHVDVEVSDGDAIEWSETIVTVDPVNDAPTAAAASVTTGRNAQVAIALTGADVDDDTLVFELATEPAHGTLEGTVPDLVFVPAADYVGPDELTFIVRDAHDAASEPATVAIEVTAGATPVAEAVDAETLEDVAVDVALTASDADGDALTFVVATPPAHGTLGGAGATLTYTPDHDYHGPDSFTYTASDGVLTSAPALASISVTPVNDAPVASATIATTSEDTAVSIALSGTDVDGDTLSFAIAVAPARGAVVITGANALYAPTANLHGADSFAFTVSDGAATSATATVSIAVAAVPDAPVAQAQNVNAVEDQPLAITLVASDGDGDTLTYTIAAAPSHGSLTGTAPALAYTPAANYHGPDSLAFVASDGAQTTAPATVSIDVASVNDPPTAANATITLLEDHTAPFTLAGADVDGDALTFSIVTPPAKGTLTGTGASRNYAPNANTNGNDPFTYQVSDGQSATTAVVTLAVTPVNDQPVAQAQNANAVEDQPLAIPLVASDGDGDTLTYTIATAPSHGTLTGTAPAVVYTPTANYHGPDSFAFVASDGAQTTAPATVSIDVASVNDPPTAANATVTLLEDQTKAFTLAGADVDGDAVTFSIVTPPAKGTLTGTGASRSYAPNANTNGNDPFTYQVSDGQSATTAIVTLAVTPVNDQPVAYDDAAIATSGQTLTIHVADNDNDVEGDPLTVIMVEFWGSTHGTATFSGGDIFYTPLPGFTGSEEFRYTIRDPSGAATTAWGYVGTGHFPYYFPEQFIGVTNDAIQFETEVLHDLSDDGHFVAFVSPHALVPEDTNGLADVYVYDRVDAALEVVSVSSSGAQGNGACGPPSLSADARRVAFSCTSSNLVVDDTNGVADVFVHDRLTGTTTRVSVGAGGAQTTEASELPAISANGQVVVFTSAGDVFVRDLEAQTTALASASSAGVEGNDVSDEVALSADGRVVAFRSKSTNLVPGDSNGKTDVFVRDVVAGTTERVSVTATGGEANGHSRRPWLSDDGHLVSFISRATNLTTGSTFAGAKGFVRDRVAATTTWVDLAYTDDVMSLRLSADGDYVTGSNDYGTVFVINRVTGADEYIGMGWGQAFLPVISRNGAYVAFLSLDNWTPLPPNTPPGTNLFVMPNPVP
jgi:hypothetical protein